MATWLTVRHVTTYRYKRPVRFGEHRLMFRPRASHDIQVVDCGVEVSIPSRVTWVQDTQSNSVTLVTPQKPGSELTFDCSFTIVHHGVRSSRELPLAPHAQRWPFDYSAEERRDLGSMLEPHCTDPEGRLFEWMRPFLALTVRPDTRELLSSMASAIRDTFSYETRDDEGTQTPDETLRRGVGTCRDFALLMMEAVRRLGMAARFVSGYLYDPLVDSGVDHNLVGAGSTHAWLHVYLPGAGWAPFDPTNAIFGGKSLIRVAYAREPRLCEPLTGSWIGGADDLLSMDVAVAVRRIKPRRDYSASAVLPRQDTPNAPSDR